MSDEQEKNRNNVQANLTASPMQDLKFGEFQHRLDCNNYSPKQPKLQ